MEKAYNRIKWENYPSVATPLNEVNLNKMDASLDEVDNRVLGLDTAKLDKAIANTMVKDISFAEDTGIFTITLLDGTTKTIDTKLEKIATNFSYDYEAQKLILTLPDGTQQEIDLSSLISQFEFVDSDTIDITVDSSGKVSAIVKDGSITENKLQPNFLADVKIEVAKAKSSSDSSYENATTARESATAAEQFRNEAEQFRNEAEAMSGINIATTEIAGIVKPDGTTIRVDPDGTIHADSGTVNYNDLENKPKINGVEITGELTTEDLNIELGASDYEELGNKPKINGVELSGNKTLDVLGIASAEKVEEIETELQETTSKVNIIIENADLGFKETASGENIHLDDSADSKLVEFALYGKAKQNTTIGKNLIPYPFYETTKTASGITFTDNGDGTITVNGTATADSFYTVSINANVSANEEYILSGCPSGGSANTYTIRVTDHITVAYDDIGNGIKFSYSDISKFEVMIRIKAGYTANNLTFKPMLRLANITDDTWEPYTGGIPSPNPEYPQDIEVSGESGSVEVKSVGKNLLPYPYNGYVHTDRGITWIDNKDGTVIANGTATSDAAFYFNENHIFKAGKYILSGCPSGGSNSSYRIQLANSDWTVNYLDIGNGASVILEEDTKLEQFRIFIAKGTTVPNLTFKPMLRLASDTDSTYEPYKSKTATIPTENGLAGIPVDSGGNYTDSNGQQWICDEIVKYADGSGEKIQRVGIINSYSVETITGVYMSTTGELTEGAKILYQLANPITTPLTPEQLSEIEKINTFYKVTNISNDFNCGMKIKYIADAKSYIDNRLAMLTNAIINSI